jgi:hypothetical protein
VFISAWTRLILSALLSAASVVAGYHVYELCTVASSAPVVVLDATDLKLAQGRGQLTQQGLEIRDVTASGTAAVIGVLTGLPATRYRSVTWDAVGLADALAVNLVWRIAQEPEVTQARLLTPEELRAGAIEMDESSGWEGQLLGVGFLIAGPLNREVIVGSVSLTPQPPRLLESIGSLARRCGYWEPWNAGSINFYAENPPGALLTPVAMVAIWIGMSLALYRLAGGKFAGRQGRTAVVLIVLGGWLVLDLRWQWVLHERLTSTKARYGSVGEYRGVSSIYQTFAEAEDALAQVAAEMRGRLPDVPSRLFILSADPGGYVSARLRYLLAPHRGYLGRLRLPNRQQARAGDYVLLVQPNNTIHYDPSERSLRWKNRSLRADLVYATAFGNLFIIRSTQR